jgi:membrane fusion protein (multidrug efflux system)
MTEKFQRDKQRRAFCGHCIRRGIPIVVLLLAIGGGYLFWSKYEHAPKAEAAPPAQGPIPVSVVTATPETVPVTMSYLGQTEGSQVVEIRARVAGYLQERTFKEGQHVQKGQKLYQIDPRPFEVELAQAKARLESSKATLERAQSQLRRFQNLSSRQTVSRDEVEQWEKDERVAQADVELQKAQIAAAELQLSYTSIESPIAGAIGKALKDTGSYVDAGQNGLVAIVQQVDPIYVRFSVSEQDILRWQRQLASKQVTAPRPEDQEIELTLSDGSVYPHKAKVNYIDIQVDQTTGTSITRGVVPNPDGLLKPGQFIYARPLGVQRVDVIRVPQKAVIQSPAGASVFVVNDKNQAEARPVTLGAWSGDEQWIVESGLKPGDKIITDRLMMVRPGAPVTILPPGPPPSQNTRANRTEPGNAPSTQPAGGARASADEGRPL